MLSSWYPHAYPLGQAMDSNRSGNISFDDFLAWYTLAHSRSGMLSKKGTAYTARFKKIMNKIGGAFDIKHLSTATAGMAPLGLRCYTFICCPTVISTSD